MRHLIVLHVNYLLSEKVFLFTVFLLAFSSLFLLYSSSVLESESTLLFYAQYYEREFTIEMVNYGKIVLMVYLLFMMIIGYVIHQYDVIILNRVGVIQLKLSKVLTMLIFGFYLTTVYFMVFVIVALYLTPYMDIGKDMIGLYLHMLFFGFFYTVMFAYLYEISKHLLGLIGGFLFYLLLFIGSVNEINKTDVSSLMKWLYRIGLDLSYYKGEGFTFYYDKSYYLGLILGTGFLVFFLRKNVDLIN